jgi:uncharacterized protein YqgC (DUF456 family)
MLKKNLRKILHIVLGITLITLGLVGLVLPILNGILLLIIGFIIISFESEYVEKKLHHFTKKNVTIHSLYHKLEGILRKFFGRERSRND